MHLCIKILQNLHICILNLLPPPEQDNLSRQPRNLSKADRDTWIGVRGLPGMKVAAATLVQLRFLTLSAYFPVLPLSSQQQGDHYEHQERTRTYHSDEKQRAWVLEKKPRFKSQLCPSIKCGTWSQLLNLYVLQLTHPYNRKNNIDVIMSK